MPNNPQIHFPADGDAINVSTNARVFLAHGQVTLAGNATAAGLNGHLVLPGTSTVKSTGSLIAWHRSGRNPQNVFQWTLLFDLGSTANVPDGNYDLLVSTYLGSNVVKTATENASSAKSEGVVVATLAGAGIPVSSPASNTQINGNQFLPYGSYTANDRPTRATMTETTTGVVTSAGTIFASGGATGGWYAAFAPLAGGTYILDVLGGTAVKTVTGLTV